MTLGLKIKLGENVVASLTKMRCPVPLQSHQIRGLDFKSLFPVFQWLVKQVISTREDRADFTKRQSELQFGKSFTAPEDVAFRERAALFVPYIDTVTQAFRPKRRFRRRDRGKLDEIAHVQTVLLEYGRDTRVGRTTSQVAPKKGAAVAKAAEAVRGVAGRRADGASGSEAEASADGHPAVGAWKACS